MSDGGIKKIHVFCSFSKCFHDWIGRNDGQTRISRVRFLSLLLALRTNMRFREQSSLKRPW